MPRCDKEHCNTATMLGCISLCHQNWMSRADVGAVDENCRGVQLCMNAQGLCKFHSFMSADVMAPGAAFRRASEVAAANGGTQGPDQSASTAVTPAAGRETSIAGAVSQQCTTVFQQQTIHMIGHTPVVRASGLLKLL